MVILLIVIDHWLNMCMLQRKQARRKERKRLWWVIVYSPSCLSKDASYSATSISTSFWSGSRKWIIPITQEFVWQLWQKPLNYDWSRFHGLVLEWGVWNCSLVCLTSMSAYVVKEDCLSIRKHFIFATLVLIVEQ